MALGGGRCGGAGLSGVVGAGNEVDCSSPGVSAEVDVDSTSAFVCCSSFRFDGENNEVDNDDESLLQN